MFQPVFLPTSLLFAGALLEIVLAGFLSRAAKGWLAFLASALALVAVFALMPAIIHGEVLHRELCSIGTPETRSSTASTA